MLSRTMKIRALNATNKTTVDPSIVVLDAQPNIQTAASSIKVNATRAETLQILTQGKRIFVDLTQYSGYGYLAEILKTGDTLIIYTHGPKVYTFAQDSATYSVYRQ